MVSFKIPHKKRKIKVSGEKNRKIFALFPIWAGKKTIFFPESFHRSLFIFEHLKMKSVTEKGLGSTFAKTTVDKKERGVGAVKYMSLLSLWRSELIQKDTGKFSELLKEAVKIRSPGATFCVI